MKILELIKLGPDVLYDKAMRGELKGADIRTAAKGFWGYAGSIASGRVASPEKQQARAAACETCPILRDYVKRSAVPGEKPQIGIGRYCGRPFAGPGRNPDGGCGCLVLVSVEGALVPAGKTEVDDETCPLGRWGEQISSPEHAAATFAAVPTTVSPLLADRHNDGDGEPQPQGDDREQQVPAAPEELPDVVRHGVERKASL